MAETETLRIPIGLDTKDVQADAKALKKEIEDAFDSSALKEQNAEMQKMAASMKQTYGKAVELTNELERLQNIEIPTEEYTEIEKQIDRDTVALQKLSNKMWEFKEWGGDTKSAVFTRMEVQADELRNSIEYAKGELQDLVDTGKAFTIGDAEGVAKVERQLDVVNDKIRIQLGNYKEATSEISKEVTEESKLADKTSTVNKNIEQQPSFIQRASVAASKFAGHMKKIASHAQNSNFSFKKLATTMLGVTLGAQGIVSIFRKLISLGKEGFMNLTKESTQAANSVNLLSAKFMQLKNSIGAALAPLVSMVTPIIARVIDLFTRAFNVVAMFFAALSGKNTVSIAKSMGTSEGAILNAGKSGSNGSNKKTPEQKYEEAVKKAQLKYEKELARYNDKVAKAEEKQAKAAAKLAKEQEKANKQLSGFDELNNLSADSIDDTLDAMEDFTDELPELEMPNMEDFLDDLSGASAGIGAMFEEIPVDSIFKEWADKFKNIVDQLISPIKQAWANVGDFVVDSWKNAWNSLKELVLSVGRDFFEVWNQPQTVKIFEDIFTIVGDIGEVVSIITDKFREAWEHNDTGLHILETIRDIIGIIVGHIREAADYTVEWAKGLDFTALLESIETLLEAIKKLTDPIMDALLWCYEEVLLPLAEWTIEELAPVLINLLADACDLLAIALEKIEPYAKWFWENFIKPVCEAELDDFITGLKNIDSAIQDITDLLEGNTTLGDYVSDLFSGEGAASKFADGVKKVPGPLSNLANMVERVSEFLKILNILFPNLKENIKQFVDNAVEKFRHLKDTIAQKIEEIKQSVNNFFTDLPRNAIQWGLDLIRNFSDGVSDSGSLLRGLGNIASDIANELGGLARDAWNWGADIVGSIADGIWDSITWVVDAARSVADTIWSYLHFSEPEEGPLANFHTFMPDMMESMVKGIEQGIPDVEKALDKLSYGIAGGTQISPNMEKSITVDSASQMTRGDMLDAMRQAFTEAMRSTGQDRDNEDIVVQIDGTEIFRAMRKEANIFNNQTGILAFG